MKSHYFFTGDHHFWHKNMIKEDYMNRPFRDDEDKPDVQMMNDEMIDRWNSIITKNDIVCYVGNISFGGYKKVREILEQLNGSFLYVRGDHDNKAVLQALQDSGKLVAPVTYIKELEINKQKIVLSPFALGVWPDYYRGSWNIYGGSFGTYKNETGKQMDVGVDAIAKRGLGYTPVPMEYVQAVLDSRRRHSPDYH